MLKYVYLLCCEHSGSTLLSFVLGSNPQIATVGELGATINQSRPYPCSCGELIQSCPFWQDVLSRMRLQGEAQDISNLGISMPDKTEKGFLSDLYYYYFPYKWQDKLRDILFLISNKHQASQTKTNKNIRLAMAISEIQYKPVFFDATKDVFRIRHLLRSKDVDLKVIFLIRDGRAVMNSLIEKENYSDLKAVKSWRWVNVTAEKIIKNYISPNKIYRVRYEDFCREQDRVLNEIAKFIGVENSFPLSNFEKKHFHIIGNRMRHQFNGKIRYAENWPKILKSHQLELFDSINGAMNRKYGY